MEEVKSTIVLEAVNSALGDSWAEFTFASNIINICVTENGCKVDITRKNIYNYCNVNLTFGGTMKNRIKELREQRGLTQEQLGELVGASRQAINAIETEKFEPSIWLAYDISKVFECAIEEVFLFDVSLRKSRADSSRQEVKSGNKISSL